MTREMTRGVGVRAESRRFRSRWQVAIEIRIDGSGAISTDDLVPKQAADISQISKDVHLMPDHARLMNCNNHVFMPLTESDLAAILKTRISARERDDHAEMLGARDSLTVSVTGDQLG
jgi:hypothetical protein